MLGIQVVWSYDIPKVKSVLKKNTGSPGSFRGSSGVINTARVDHYHFTPLCYQILSFGASHPVFGYRKSSHTCGMCCVAVGVMCYHLTYAYGSHICSRSDSIAVGCSFLFFFVQEPRSI
jgi:hypothetical protein